MMVFLTFFLAFPEGLVWGKASGLGEEGQYPDVVPAKRSASRDP
jgi:hypothetical protein